MSAPLPFVGRDRERARLRGALNSAMAGRGAVALIGGEAGIGKTTLAELLCQQTRERGALVLTGRCYDLTETGPYAPWVELFAGYVASGELPAIPRQVARCEIGGDLATQAALFAAVQGFLAEVAAARPLVLLLEDQHWADTASLDLLRFVARQAGQHALLVLVTYRTEEVEPGDHLSQILPLIARESPAVRINLQPLTGDDLWAIVRSRYQLAAVDEARLTSYLQRRTEGVPFFISELLESLEESNVLIEGEAGWTLGNLGAARTPVLVEQIVGRRLAQLSEDDRQLMAVAAVLGEEVPLALWSEVAETSELGLLELLERASAARLMGETADGRGARFTHALVRQVIYDRLTPARRRYWHQRAGSLLADAADPDPDAVANHFRRSGDPRALEWLIRAGDRADRAAAWQIAVGRFTAAAEMLAETPGGDQQRGWLLVRIARLHRLSNPVTGLEQLAEAGRIAAACGDRALSAMVLWHSGLLHCLNGEIHHGIDLFQRGVEAFEALTPDEREHIRELEPISNERLDRHHKRATVAMWLSGAGRYREAMDYAEPYIREAVSESELSSINGDAYVAWANSHIALGDLDAAREAFELASSAYRNDRQEFNLARTIARILQMLVLTFDTDNLARRRQLVAEAEAAWRRGAGMIAGDLPGAMQLPLQMIEGQWSALRETAGELREQGTSTMRAEADYWLGLVALAQGDRALGWKLVNEWLPAGPVTQPGHSPFRTAHSMQHVAAHLALIDGDLTTARRWLDAGDRWLAWSGALIGQARQALAWVDYHRAAGDLAAARERAEGVMRLATDPRQPLELLSAHRLLGELDTLAGRHAEAAAHLDVALTLAEACAAPFEIALVMLARGELEMARGDASEAGRRLAAARAILEPLEARPALARADALAAQLAGTAQAGQSSVSGSVTAEDLALLARLSKRERDVLGLLPAGYTNQQIAELLYVSPKTIESHIGRVLAKTGLPNRAAAAAFAQRLGLSQGPAPEPPHNPATVD